MSFYRAFYHLVWSTKYRSELITPDIEPMVHDIIWSKAIQLDGIVFTLNGTDNHIHLVTAVPPSKAVTDFVGQIKGITSYRLNQAGNRSVPFAWQTEFGMFTFDEKRLPNYVNYVERQKEHHAENRLIPILKHTDATSFHSIQEPALAYSEDDCHMVG